MNCCTRRLILPSFCGMGVPPVRSMQIISTPVASELILLTVRTRQCRVPTINGGRDTALPCPLYHSHATGNNIRHEIAYFTDDILTFTRKSLRATFALGFDGK